MNPSDNRARRITRNALSLFGAEAFSRLFTWCTILYLTRHWTDVASYGRYATAVNWITLFVTFSDLGFNVLTIREVAHHKELSGFYLRNVMALKLIFSAFFYAAMVLAGWLLHYERVLQWAMVIIGLRLFLEAASAAYVYLLQAHELMFYQGLIVVLSGFFRMAGIVSVVHFGGGLAAVCWVWVADDILVTAVLLWWGFKKGWRPGLASFSLKEGLTVLSGSLPLAAFGTFQMLYNRVDAVMLKSFSGNAAVAFYDVASRFLFVTLLLSNLFSVSVLPALSASQDDPADFGRLCARALKALAFLGMPLTVGGVLLAGPLMTLLFGEKYAFSGPAFSVLALVILFSFLVRVPVNILAVKNTNRLIRMYAVLFVLNVAMNLFAIPRWGLMGAAYSSAAGGVLELLIGLGSARRYLGATPKGPVLRGLASAFLASALMGAGIYWSPRLYWLVLGPLVYALGLWAFRALDPEDWKSLRSALRMGPT